MKMKKIKMKRIRKKKGMKIYLMKKIVTPMKAKTKKKEKRKSKYLNLFIIYKLFKMLH